MSELTPERKAEIEAEEAYRAQVRARSAPPAPPPKNLDALDPEAQRLNNRPPPIHPAANKTNKGNGCWTAVGVTALIIVGLPLLFSMCAPSPGGSTYTPGTTTSTDTDYSSSGSDSSSSATGAEIIGGSGYIGCPSRETLDELVGYASQKDEAAFRTRLLNSDCIVFKEGESVYLEDVPFLSGVIKVRRAGETQGYWTVSEATQ